MENINKKYLVIGVIGIIIFIIIILNILNTRENTYDNYDSLEIVENTEERKEEQEKAVIKVHVAGAVVNEGIVELEEGSRIEDAIKAAGGTTVDADIKKINLAQKIQDGQKIYIPIEGEENYTIESDSLNNNI